MMEPVEMPPFKEGEIPAWGIDGTTKIMEDYDSSDSGVVNDAKYRAKLELMEASEQRWETFCIEDAEVVLVAVGMTSRVCRGAVKRLREQGVKAGLLRPISAWPFPVNGFAELPASVKKLICVEVDNYGQVIEDVLIAAKKVEALRTTPVYSYAHHRLMTSNDVVKFVNAVNNNEVQEVG